FGTSGIAAPAVISERAVHVIGTTIPESRFVLGGMAVTLAAGLWALYRFTRFGVMTRAASENEPAALLTGLSPDRLSRLNPTPAFAIAATFGILVAPVTQLDPDVLSNAIVPALGAALLAGFSSFGIAAGAGLAMGVIQSLVVYLQSMPWFPTSQGLPLSGV